MISPKVIKWLVIIGIIVAALLWVVDVVRENVSLKKDVKRLSGNQHSFSKAPSETTTEFNVTKKELKEDLPEVARELDSLGIKRPVVYHKIYLKGETDTVVKTDTVYVKDGDSVRVFKHSENCVTGTYTVFKDSMRVEQSVEPNFAIVTELHRPKWWFWRLKWNSAKWPDSTTVKNNCGWTIKQNVRINIVK